MKRMKVEGEGEGGNGDFEECVEVKGIMVGVSKSDNSLYVSCIQPWSYFVYLFLLYLFMCDCVMIHLNTFVSLLRFFLN